jgi:uncharacterized protein DUF2568
MYKASMLVLLFALELVAVVALAYWGFTMDTGLAMRFVFGLGMPALAVLLWAMFAAPKARIRVSGAAVVAVKILVYGAAVLAIAATGHIALAVAFLGLVLLVTGLIRLGRLDAGMRV